MERKFRDRSGVYRDAPFHWVSNEAWPDSVVYDVVSSGGDSAVVVGSGNVSTIVPLMPGLKGVSFVDVEPGQRDILASRIFASEQVLQQVKDQPRLAGSISTLTSCYYQSFGVLQPQIGKVELLKAEAHVFDLLRSDDFHYTTSVAGLERLRSLLGSFQLGEFTVDITKPEMAEVVMNPPGSGRVGWVHVSNVAMTEYRSTMHNCSNLAVVEKCAHSVGTSIIDFVSRLSGVDDETLITYACYDPEVKYADQMVPVVSSSNLASLTPDQLLSKEDRVLW